MYRDVRNRDACFFDEQDYAFYLQQLQISAEQFGVAIHAFVLMTNNVHLLVTPKAADFATWAKRRSKIFSRIWSSK